MYLVHRCTDFKCSAVRSLRRLFEMLTNRKKSYLSCMISPTPRDRPKYIERIIWWIKGDVRIKALSISSLYTVSDIFEEFWRNQSEVPHWEDKNESKQQFRSRQGFYSAISELHHTAGSKPQSERVWATPGRAKCLRLCEISLKSERIER